MTTSRTHSAAVAVAVAAIVCAAAIAACGTSTKPGAGGDPLLAYARCMRAHGLTGFPDPSPGRGLAIPNDINPESPAFTSAQRACGKLAQGPSDRASSSAGSRQRLFALARCMRAHGVTRFADPTSSPPPPSSGNAIGGGGWYLALGTQQERQSPAYKHAATACHSALP